MVACQDLWFTDHRDQTQLLQVFEDSVASLQASRSPSLLVFIGGWQETSIIVLKKEVLKHGSCYPAFNAL